MEPLDEIPAQRARDQEEAEASISRQGALAATGEARAGSVSDILLLLGVIAVVLVCLLTLKIKSSASAPPATAAIAQQQAPPPVVNAAYVQWDTTMETAMARAKAVHKPIMIDFYTDWCGYCKQMDSEVYTNQQVINESQNFVNVKINAEQYTDLAAKYDVHRYPTLIFTDADGNQTSVIHGYLPPAEFLQALRRYPHA